MENIRNKEFLYGMNLEEMKGWLQERGEDIWLAVRILCWFYRKRITDFTLMDDIPKRIRKELNAFFIPGFYPPSASFRSSDGSIKYLFPVGDKGMIESVFMPDRKRNTLCVSSQAGCRMGCRFCRTARVGFHGNLSAGEIVNQAVSIPESLSLSHLVFMGMGEPLDNYDTVLKSIEILTAPWGMALSPGHITLSTVGVLPVIQRFLEDTRCHLAISLHTPFPEERQEWIPAERKYPVMKVLELVNKFPLQKKRRISIEYAMVNGKNDTEQHLREMVRILSPTHFRVNLIPFHPFEGCEWKPGTDERITLFMESLNKAGISCTVRQSRGKDIGAACGQLGSSVNPLQKRTE